MYVVPVQRLAEVFAFELAMLLGGLVRVELSSSPLASAPECRSAQ